MKFSYALKQPKVFLLTLKMCNEQCERSYRLEYAQIGKSFRNEITPGNFTFPNKGI